jgi:hypothetical protein
MAAVRTVCLRGAIAKPDALRFPRARRLAQAERRRSLQRDFIAFHDSFRSELGVAMPRDYLVTIGVRK